MSVGRGGKKEERKKEKKKKDEQNKAVSIFEFVQKHKWQDEEGE